MPPALLYIRFLRNDPTNRRPKFKEGDRQAKSWRSGVARGQGRVANHSVMKNLVFEKYSNLQKTDTLEGSFEIASETALFFLDKGISLYPKGRFPYI